MGIVPDFSNCKEFITSFRNLGENIHSHYLVQKIISFCFYVNYYVQTGYDYLYSHAVDFYYSHVNTNYETVSVFTNNDNIDTLIYSNHKTCTYRTIMSNRMSLKQYKMMNEKTREFIDTILDLRNPVLSAMMTITNSELNFEKSFEINKILDPFLFPSNVIDGNPEFVSFLIHEYVKEQKGNNNDEMLCPVIKNANNISDYQIDISYMTLNDVGLITIPCVQKNSWTLTVDNNNVVFLEIKEKED